MYLLSDLKFWRHAGKWLPTMKLDSSPMT